MEDTQKLLESTVQGDTASWVALQAELEPVITRMARRHRDLRRRGLGEQPDDIAEVRTASLERLAAHDFRNLRDFLARRAQLSQPESFESWLYGVVDFAVRDHLRKRYGRAPKVTAAEGGGVQPSKRDLQSLAGRWDDEPERKLLEGLGVTTRLTMAEIAAFIAESFSADEAAAIRLYYVEGQTYPEIASALSLQDSREAEQLIRRLNARLRYRFAPRDSEG